MKERMNHAISMSVCSFKLLWNWLISDTIRLVYSRRKKRTVFPYYPQQVMYKIASWLWKYLIQLECNILICCLQDLLLLYVLFPRLVTPGFIGPNHTIELVNYHDKQIILQSIFGGMSKYYVWIQFYALSIGLKFLVCMQYLFINRYCLIIET